MSRGLGLTDLKVRVRDLGFKGLGVKGLGVRI